MSGNLQVSSKEGSGSQFKLAVPLRRHNVAESKPVAAHDSADGNLSALAGCRVLVADDNETNRFIAKSALEEAGCIVELASDGVEAVHSFRTASFDLILMACQMPAMDGYQATGIIRQDPAERGRSIPILAAAASAFPEDRQRCIAAQMNDFIAKPYSISGLVGKCADLLIPNRETATFAPIMPRAKRALNVSASRTVPPAMLHELLEIFVRAAPPVMVTRTPETGPESVRISRLGEGMKRGRFSEEQIIGILKRHEAGQKLSELAREYGISDATIYSWKDKYGGMEVSEAQRLKSLEDENLRLNHLVADLSLDKEV